MFTIFYFAAVGEIVFPDYKHVSVVEPHSSESLSVEQGLPGGTTFTIRVNMLVQEFSEKGALFKVRLRSEQIRGKGIFLGRFG